METITSQDGTVIGYRRRGTGPPLLLVHGVTVDHRIWSALSPHLERHLTVYAMDRRGRGASGDSPGYDLTREAEDVAMVVEAIGEPVVLFGHSFGALCSLEAALLTGGVSRLILYEPPIPTGVPTIPPAVAEQMQAFVDCGDLEAAMDLFLREAARIPPPELRAYRQSPLWNATLPLAPTIPRELAIDWTYRFDGARFARLQLPTLLLLGSESPPFYRQGIELLDAALPISRVALVPGHQHMAHLNEPELVGREVLQFLLTVSTVGAVRQVD